MRSLRLYFMQGAVLLLGLGIMRLWWIGRLEYYIHPSTSWVVIGGGLTLCVLVLVWMYKGEDHFHATSRQIGGLLLIALLVVGTKNAPLSARLAKQREADTVTPLAGRAQINAQGSTASFNVLEWLAAWESDPTHQRYLGKPTKVEGFISEENGQLFVNRFLITCCAVDAQPVRLVFQLPEGEKVPQGGWIRVEGVMGEQDGKPIIIATTVTSISEPENPYVY